MNRFFGLFMAMFLVLLPMLAQHFVELDAQVETEKEWLYGTLVLPHGKKDSLHTIVLLISGSRPTDRNGNTFAMENNALKFIAQDLARYDIASLRYDKRGVGESAAAYIADDTLLFMQNVNDAKKWIDYIKALGYKNIVVAGHSEGALVGLLLAQQDEGSIKKYISIAGAGRPIDVLLKEQYAKMAPNIRDSAYSVIDSLKKQVVVPHLSPWLFSVFRPDIQPYIISWMQLSPATIISKLSIPVLLIQGTTDVQLSHDDITQLHINCKHAQVNIIENMNHILKKVVPDKLENKKSYNMPNLPLHPELMLYIVSFIKSRE